ncbi:hypothetical protein JTE90_017261 [Oedothorax gibbosus]|uniref:RZ-type domain-containing protein n=1 Tax=Oedothorax gibbosus TaxID=931172 RepID=A0AAV6VFL5_9ARAC|nr:hypothetical protein JTE90_017261 [Oedothorax gibbosus]
MFRGKNSTNDGKTKINTMQALWNLLSPNETETPSRPTPSVSYATPASHSDADEHPLSIEPSTSASRSNLPQEQSIARTLATRNALAERKRVNLIVGDMNPEYQPMGSGSTGKRSRLYFREMDGEESRDIAYVNPGNEIEQMQQDIRQLHVSDRGGDTYGQNLGPSNANRRNVSQSHNGQNRRQNIPQGRNQNQRNARGRGQNQRQKQTHGEGENRRQSNTHEQNQKQVASHEQHPRHPNQYGRNQRELDNFGQDQLNDDGQNSRRRAKREHPIGLDPLRDLCDKDPNEILLTILHETSGFTLLLQQKEIQSIKMAYVLIAAGKAINSRMRSNVNAMINLLTSSTNNFLSNFTPYLASRQKYIQENKPYHLESLVSMTDFLYKFQRSLPSSASDTIIEVLPLLEKTCKLCLYDEVVKVSVLKKLQLMEEDKDNFLKEYTPKEAKQVSRNERLQYRNPPESFRSIPVLPTTDDIRQPCPFLRPNLVQGQYQDTEHYLDVQYRLLREDYVTPLREGIAEYLMLKKLGKSFKRCKDVKVYPNVNITKQDFVNGGLVHIACFNDASFSKIKWDYSKRFLTGSLLCFSSDDFETMLFASVAKRDPKELVKGLLLMKFEEITDEVLNISPLRNFVVVETSAYFEAYRHNLDALLDLNEERLPMKSYIIEVEKNGKRPEYLRESSTYDMRPLLIPLDEKNLTYKQNSDGDIVCTYDFPENISHRAKNIQILRDDYWPTATELNLDHSQYAAIKAAVTKEFAVIQGPPGTGKTYVGLRIAQLLLHNIEVWQNKVDPSPILVVCYTNHALDQFLEGLMLFTQKIVRVGGRVSNEALDKFRLGNLKRVTEEKREVPAHIFKCIGRKNYELRELKNEIAFIKQETENCFESVIPEISLGNCISSIHVDSLKIPYLGSKRKSDGRIILDWLNIRRKMGDKYVYLSHFDVPEEPPQVVTTLATVNPVVNRNQNEAPEEETDSEEEGDIEFIEAQRDIDSEEFNDVSFEVKPLQRQEVEVVSLPQEEDGWQVQGGSKNKMNSKRYVANSLRRNQAMSEREVNGIGNVWYLTLQQRWRLYKFWLERFIQKKQDEVFKLQQQLKKEFEELCEMRTEEDLYVCKKAHVVGMTTTGAAKYRNIVQHLNPRIVIVEEAAEILESHIVTSLAPGTKHVILIGDHQQLKPSPAVYSLATKFSLDVSLFERMLKNGMECHRLGIQHRMRPEIAALLVPHIYKDLQNHESVANFENINGISKNVYFVTHDHIESSDSDSRSKANEHEAEFLIKLCRYILQQGYESYQITVLTTYTGQLFALKKLVAKNNILKAVRFTVVDNYQGEENDIILISFVRSNQDGSIGFLKVSNRVCVALSRARKGLFCIGNFELLVDQSPLWKNITDVLHKNQSIGPSLQLTCQNHPGVSSVVATAKDFESVPEGGCTRNCEYRLKCGHVCSLTCHPYDTEHLKVQCHKPCGKKCVEDLHKCKKKCFQNCGNCNVMVDKKIVGCGHTIKVECHAQHGSFVCTHRCERYLACGDLCPNACGVACAMKCKKKKKVVSPVCGHQVEVECYNVSNIECLIAACKEPCRVKLSCDHTCKGTCSKCHQGRMHVRCNLKCKRILVCGHECSSTCSKSCPPCRRPCENRCVHSKCPKKCGEPCQKCAEPCEWSCDHIQCRQPCGELCGRLACDQPCQKQLPCNHACIGLCGEPCPQQCKICNENEVTDIFFGSEDEEGAKFIALEDCSHIFELSGIEQWMKHDMHEGKREIQMKTCPRCKVVIRKNLRFGNIVKRCLADIEKVKQQTFGESARNEHKQQRLLLTVESKSIDEKISRIIEPLVKTLTAGKVRSIQELTVMENIINISASLAKSVNLLESAGFSAAFSDRDIKEIYDQVLSYMKRNKTWMISFMQDEYLTASEQQLEELTWEVHRMKFARKLLRLLQMRLGARINQHFIDMAACLTKYAPFCQDDVTKFTEAYNAVSDGAVLNISDLEKTDILKAMGLSAGHWYQCPNGHVYCITECGGAMEESRCNECGARIGGAHHALRNDNRVATAMDGSRHGAWSDAMNMDNYRF